MILYHRDLMHLKQDLLDQTDTYRNLAKKYKVHEVTIRRYNKKWGLQRPPINFKGLEEAIKNKEGSKQELAERFNYTPKTVYNVKKRLGLVVPKK